MINHKRVFFFLLGSFVASCALSLQANELKVLFLGDRGPHRPADRFADLQPVLAKQGIQLDYTDNVGDLNPEKLSQYAALVLYANIDRIAPAQEKALLDYVEQGGGFVPLHCATFCFRNSDQVIALMGAQFQRHGTGVFRTQIADDKHPIMQGFGGFESWDETYVHHLHNERNRTVLSYRVDSEGREPWTWVRTQGKGRVFYTAWGHDQRTWRNSGFQNLVERGIRWAAKDDPAVAPDYRADMPFPVPKMTPLSSDAKPFEYVDVGREIPNYLPSDKWGVQGEKLSKMQKPLAPEESMKHLVVPQGFHVELFASEPEIGGKPICMAWDERGRLWVAETVDYPNELQPIGEGRDRIRILEDTDGDWRADKFTIFAEKLSIPTSITFHRGGAIVQNGTETLYLKDTDGDDVADERTVLFSGWAAGDTHGGVSNFQYGLDNWIWAMQGYNDSQPVVNGKQVPYSFRQGFMRFRPDGSELEFLRSTNNNTWGLGISEEGIVFGSTANSNPSVYLPIPNRYYERVKGWTPSLTLETIADTYLFKPITKKVRQVDHHGGYTAAAGHALYTAREYPQEYWNRTAFVNGPTGHLVGTFVLKPDGSDFHSTSPFNLLASDDEWTAPIMSEVGPDGQVWVLDWYNYIVQHNPTPEGFETGKGAAYITKLRDKKHGRIYRVVPGKHDAAAPQPFTLQNASPEKLLETLSHPTMLWRKHAQRLLVERGNEEVVPELIRLTADQSIDSIGLNVGVIHALWTLQGLNQLDGSHKNATAAATASLKHPSPGVRRNALQVLPRSIESTQAIVQSGAIDDTDAQVRLAALLALADQPPSEGAGEAILAALERATNEQDRWLRDAAICAGANNSDAFLAAVALRESRPSASLLEAVQIVAEHYGRNAPVDNVAALFGYLAQSTNQAAVEAIVDGIATAWPSARTPQLTAAFDDNLSSVLAKLPAASQGKLVKLARNWGSQQLEEFAENITETLLDKLDDEALRDGERVKAARELVAFTSTEEGTVEEILERITPQTSADLAKGMLRALHASESPEVGNILVQYLPKFTPRARSSAIETLLARQDSTTALLQAIDDRVVQLDELTLEQKQSLTSSPDRAIRQRAKKLLSRGGSLPSPDRQKVLADLMSVTTTTGDASIGKKIFTKQCAKCHTHSGEGSHIGPDLTGMAVHPKAELLTHILDPNRNVEGNYRVYIVLTQSGKTYSGLLASESKTSLEIIDAEGKKHAFLREDVEELSASGLSLMPEGFEKELSKQDLTDLLEFLTQRGSFEPLDISTAATISSATGMFINATSREQQLVLDDWSPKTVAGVPFQLIDPEAGEIKNVIELYGPRGQVSKQQPKSVKLPCETPLRAIHLLSGVSGWGFPFSREQTVSLVVRLTYANGETEDHQLLNGVHFADYIRKIEVPKSLFAFEMQGGQQMRYLAVHPRSANVIREIEFVKGSDQTAPVVMAVTLEKP